MKMVRLVFALAAFAAPFCAGAAAQDAKLKPEDVVAKHLESIGPADKLAAVHSRRASGSVQMKLIHEANIALSGQAFLLFEAPKLRVALRFTDPGYKGEDLAYDGKKAATAAFYAAQRSTLAQFFRLFNKGLEEGLFGGSLSSSWSLLRFKELQPYLEYAGLRKVGEEEFQVLRYRPRKGSSDVKIEMYFDPQTFRHVRTIYIARLEMPQSATGFSARNTPMPEMPIQSVKVTVEENFSDFRTVDGVTLPMNWVIRSTSVSGADSGGIISTGRNERQMADVTKPVTWEWQVKLKAVTHNEPNEASLFVIQ